MQKIMITVFYSVLAVTMMALPSLAWAVDVGQAGDGTVGGVMMDLQKNTSSLPGVFSGFSYLAGLFFGFLAIMKTKEHVENPNQTPIYDPLKRTLAAGAFFALPTVTRAAIRTVGGQNNTGYRNSGFSGESTGEGLDAMIVNLMTNIFVPSQWIFAWFGYLAGFMLVIVGISRLLKSEQDGPRGPTGIGTIMTFVVAGCLFSMNAMISYFSETLFGTATIKTEGTLAYAAGLGGAAPHAHAVISAIVAFSILLGWVSLLRGFFILRGVSEGNSQASMMAALTHLIGGALAINLGPIINAVQKTLGISQYGITFS
jgi:hypothetical protein